MIARPAGLVLAGGRSSRFGSEKALAVWEGKPLLAHVLVRLAPDCAAVAVSAREGSGAAALARELGLTVLHDAAGDADGPLAGIRAGLGWAATVGARALVVAPCDTPFLPADYVARLVAALDPAPAAFVETPAGAEPLCSAWTTGLSGELAQALADGAHPSTIAWLRDHGAVPALFADAAPFRNINRVTDLTG